MWNPARGPRPTVKGTVFYRSAGALGCHTRIREGFPRNRCMARDRPSPYGEGNRFFRRSAGALGCHTRIREGFPRNRCMARDRPSPYVKGRRFFHRSAGPVTATLNDLGNTLP